MKKILLSIFFLLTHLSFNYAQELNARVQIIAPQISNLNNRQIEDLQNQIRSFLNSTKWTDESYSSSEKIDCSFTLTITRWDGNSSFSSEAQIQSSRPIYGTSYLSTILNINDKDFDFNYNQGQVLDFSDNNYILNLTSILAFYAYSIIGIDKDTFQELSGTKYHLKAQNVLNQAQMSGNKGWKANDGLRNRYWLNENLLNTNFSVLRQFLYTYHFSVLDLLTSNRTQALSNLLSSLEIMNQFDKQRIGSYFPNVYFSAKAEETTNLILMLKAADKLKAISILSQIDPANAGKYANPTLENQTF